MRTAWSIPLLLALAAFACGAKGAPASRRAPGGPPPGSRPRKGAAARPFRAGEKLFYQIEWMNMSEAATAELKVEPRRNFYGDPVWHFQAVAHTEDPLRLLMAVDDQFDSYCDAGTLVSRRYEMYLNEQGKRSVRKLALGGGSPGAERVSAPAGTRDPLAMLYRLRLVDWQRTPRFGSPVYDGKHFYRLAAQLAAAHDSVIVPAGKFDASRIAITVSPRDQAGEPMQFTLWLANDSARTPVEVDAQIRLGTIQGVLAQIE
ncbi:MAG TPA: DUF3108 domain-containing protein [Patescibacteria group bacterium]|nr:DUF3108 domain-containing protein [Patescibacteria group bacterium]